MTNEEMRELIAEDRGWIRCPTCNQWVNPITRQCEALELSNTSCPNWPEDLNACHEMEESLGIDGPDYALELWRNIVAGNVMSDRKAMWKLSHATARQRCEAFLRVKGLWKEEAK